MSFDKCTQRPTVALDCPRLPLLPLFLQPSPGDLLPHCRFVLPFLEIHRGGIARYSLCLASFTRHQGFKRHPGYCIYGHVPFYCPELLLRVDTPLFVCPSAADGHWGSSQCGATVKRAAVDTWVQALYVWANIFLSVFDPRCLPVQPPWAGPSHPAEGARGHQVLAAQGVREAVSILAAASPEPVGSVPGLTLEFPPAPGERW